MDEAAIEVTAASPPSSPISPRSPPSTTHAELARALGLTLRADVDALNNTIFHTANIFGLWVAPGFNDPDHYAPICCRAASNCPTATTTSPTART